MNFSRKNSKRLVIYDLNDVDKWQKLGAFFDIDVPTNFEVHKNRSGVKRKTFVTEKLRAKSSEELMNKDKFFIYVGLHKVGSTWLYSVLYQHPETEMPNIKEIDYFFVEEKIGFTLFGRQFAAVPNIRQILI